MPGEDRTNGFFVAAFIRGNPQDDPSLTHSDLLKRRLDGEDNGDDEDPSREPSTSSKKKKRKKRKIADGTGVSSSFVVNEGQEGAQGETL